MILCDRPSARPQELRGPGVETLRCLAPLPRGSGGTSDFVDALTVVTDLVIKASQALVLDKVPKKLTIISNFAQQVGARAFSASAALLCCIT